MKTVALILSLALSGCSRLARELTPLLGLTAIYFAAIALLRVGGRR